MQALFLKYHYYFVLAFIILFGISSCKQAINKNDKQVINSEALLAQKVKTVIDLSGVPNDTITYSNLNFSIKNGLFYFKDKKYSGILKKYHPKVKMVVYISVYNGKRHGPYNSYYENGRLCQTKQYKNNKITGRHYIYWKNGNLKISYWYYNGIKEGVQKRWYRDGSPFCEFNYKNGKRNGKQKAWRTSGKLQINNEIINGNTYGLNRASLCYNVQNEKPDLIGYSTERPKKPRK
ncbi:hypothetical protein KO500_02255 [Cellulophaga baltica]|uniref:toxin-antitoxin system YwqK family antitoxin n=1 Tax=Cellulophaga TaxID=104264 RepID=UPI001C075057|nr:MULTISPECIES: hypothetical protein [Cellulophaga]MBU2995232.1 hypothetical protein [Cellulophaga baltica]MDO6766627.1 hypothetical protein [Cellulophaga sp. 1_MG-2023]